jgi:mono/diheme cytochrome c family protein
MLPLLLSCAGASPTQLAGCPIGPVRGAPFAAAVPIPAGGDAARGGRLFEAECSKCHAPRIAERGSRLFRAYPRLDCAAYLERADDGYLGTVISAGGAAVGLDDAMKPFGQRLTPAGIADLVAYLRAAPAQP